MPADSHDLRVAVSRLPGLCSASARALLLGAVAAIMSPAVMASASGVNADDPQTVEHARAAFEVAMGEAAADFQAYVRESTARIGSYNNSCALGDRQLCVAEERERGWLSQFERLREACQAGKGQGCFLFGDLLEKGVFQKPYPAQASAAYAYGCRLGSQDACVRVGLNLYNHGGSVEKQSRGLVLLREACGAGVQHGCEMAEQVVAQVGPRLVAAGKLSEARALYTERCAAQDVVSCGHLSFMVLNGEGGPVDLAAAQVHSAKACASGRSGPGCTVQGVLYSRGLGVPQDLQKGMDFLTRGCDAGHVLGCMQALGILLSAPEGSRDFAKARSVAGKACQLEEMTACGYYGELAITPGSGQPDLLAAAVESSKACKAGISRACRVVDYLRQQCSGKDSFECRVVNTNLMPETP